MAMDAINPWDAAAQAPSTDFSSDALATAADADIDPWTLGNSGAQDAGNTDWLEGPDLVDAAAQLADGGASQSLAQATGTDAGQGLSGGFDIHQWLGDSAQIQTAINHGLEWVVTHFRPFFQTVRAPIDATLTGVENLLTSVPSMVMIALMVLLAWQFAGRAIAIGTLASLAVVALLGIWPEAMVTLSLVLTSLAFCIVIGLPVGIALAASDRAQRWTRPFLDAMQTTPAFVYLVPVVMLFGIGNVPGVIVTIVFALPPLIRLTNLGIRQVRPDLIEASRAYGASPMQMLLKVQLPLAMPSIMAGINQALMLSLSMVVIASMIAVGGLGQMVLRGIGRLDMGLATVGGLGIVLLAIALDRITQAMGKPRRGGQHWWQSGPVGLLLRLLQRSPQPAAHKASVATAAVSH
ncbi:glycine betaine/L-proline ABC transporter permease ProW [Pantoea sp. 18069]|uniref:glycine betaine/L-proline ABC transporter permease ProW n=1 Tax=Pantoea sp. 18069 TaxID=2681415 RepID=UPI0013596C0F|nr:glycine betaine/L-proline ABC transporter permease ProW [Pantoea sp. 18069]